MQLLNLERRQPVPVPAKRPVGRPPLSAEKLKERATRQAITQAQNELALCSNPVDQVRLAFSRGNRLSALFGIVLGGFIPLASYTLVHDPRGVVIHPHLWVLIAGAFIYSSFSVFSWVRSFFDHILKALGFVILLEGVLITCDIEWLSLSGLAILFVLNGVIAAVTLQKPRTEE